MHGLPVFFSALLTLLAAEARADSADSIEQTFLLEAARRDANAAAIPALVEQYANTLGCVFHLDPQNVIAYPEQGPHTRLVVFALDVGCSGGSHRQRPVVALVRLGGYQKFFIDAAYSTPKQTADALPAQLTRVYRDGNTVRFEGLAQNKPVSGALLLRDNQWQAAP